MRVRLRRQLDRAADELRQRYRYRARGSRHSWERWQWTDDDARKVEQDIRYLLSEESVSNGRVPDSRGRRVLGQAQELLRQRSLL